MRLLRLNTTGLFSYGESPWIELANQGIVLLQGQNGAGKSSLFNGLVEVLYGNSPQREGTRDVTENDVVNSCWKGQAFGGVELEAGGAHYRVLYTRNWKGDPIPLSGRSAQLEEAGPYVGTSLWFERWDGERWVQKGVDGSDLRFPKMADTWAKVASVIGMDYQAFCNVAYVAQDRALRFIKGKNTDREEIITQIKRLGVYDDAGAAAKARRDTAGVEAARSRTAADTLAVQERAIVVDDVTALRQRATDAEDAIGKLTGAIEAAQEEVRAAQARQQSRDAIAGGLRQELQGIVATIHANTAEVERHRAAITQERQKAGYATSRIPIDLGDGGLAAKLADVQRCRAISEQENRRLLAMLPGAGKCGHCGSVLDVETLARHKAEQAALVAGTLDQHTAAEQAAEQVRQENEARYAARAAEIDAALRGFVEAAEKATTDQMAHVLLLEAQKGQLQTQVAAAEADARSDPFGHEAAATVQRLMGERARWETERATVTAAVQLADRRAADRARIADQLAAAERSYSAAALEAEEWGWLAKHCPKVKQLKFASVLQDLNERLAQSLGILTSGKTRVTLSPFRVKKDAQKKAPEKRTADDYIFEFEMVVEEAGKVGVPIQLYSGGERELITVALISAFWELAATEGAGSNVLLLDEVIAFLNESAIERVVQLVDHLRSRVETVILVGHDPALTNFLRPDAVWYARKAAGVTTLEITDG